MGTRSNVIIKVKPDDIGRVLTHEFKGTKYDTKIEKPYVGIYCHWDGYISGVGEVLFEHYKDYEKVLELISGGFTSSIDYDDVNYYMGWDREELWQHNKPRQSDTPKVCGGWTEYAYIFEDDKWHVGLVEWKDDDSYNIVDIVELTADVVAKGHPKEREE